MNNHNLRIWRGIALIAIGVTMVALSQQKKQPHYDRPTLLFERLEDEDGQQKWFWWVRDTNGVALAESVEAYPSQDQAAIWWQRLRNIAASDPEYFLNIGAQAEPLTRQQGVLRRSFHPPVAVPTDAPPLPPQR